MSSETGPNAKAPRIIKQAELVSGSYFIGQREGHAPDLGALERAESIRLRAETEAHCREMLMQAEQQAEAVMSEARTEAVRLLNEAQQRVQQLEAQARAEGLARGEAEGQAKLQSALAQFQAVMLAAHADRARLLAGSEAEVVRMVLQIVRKILKIEPIINEQVLIRVCRDALERLGQRVDVMIHVHPEDVELLHFGLSQLQDLALEIVIEADDRVEPGGCRIESRAAEIDARLSTQFDAVARSFLAVAEGSENPLE
ncbi:MAG: hypothetical protein CVV27_14580 [Candidatus Melainabacteria bacterium HGW-Melainabacteria-1]|nr:MAG: hypothetical protein CVV27_14580 [Candidatus Melainabacteria bacterium HGW-Melainabacteria-1]